MKFTLSWLKEHLETSAPLEEITDKLTSLGLVVDAVENKGEALKGFIIAEVVEAEKHPNADKLQVLKVTDGSQTYQVVCGAPNARAGLKGVFALPGMTIPALGITLKQADIRGVQSSGMMCSERELGLGEDHNGIIDLPADAPVGKEYAPYARLDDPVIEIEITPNRGDCLGVRGIARDLAAAGPGTLKPLSVPSVKGSFKAPLSLSLNFSRETTDACPYFTGRLIKGVKNGPSPDWLQRKLKAVGLRPISALVDITNLMAYDRGRPMHVFDADKLKGNISLRLSKQGETLKALDEKTYTLDEGTTVICDDSGVISLAGIMGGESTGCTESTVNVFLESATFSPIRTAITGRKLGILSDSRYRFERSTDPAVILECLEQATRLILDLCGGEASDVLSEGTPPLKQQKLTFDFKKVATLGGLDLPQKTSEDILRHLGFDVEAQGTQALVTVPSWRHDIDGAADLVEEILRVRGYQNIPLAELPKPHADEEFESTPGASHLHRRLWTSRRALSARGMVEALTWSFIRQDLAELFEGGEPEMRVLNPISQDMATMRPGLLPTLLQAAQRNLDRGLCNPVLFEVGSQFGTRYPLQQTPMISGVMAEKTAPRHWGQENRSVDAYDAKAHVEAVLEACGFDAQQAQIDPEGAPRWYHPGRSGAFKLGPKITLATFGEVHPVLLQKLKLDGPMVAFEVFIESIPLPKGSSQKGAFIGSTFQPVERDFAFLVDREIPADKLLSTIRKVDKNLITDVLLFDVYEGKGVPEGKKSMALSVRLEPRDKTMTDEEIQAVSQKIMDAAKKAAGAELRQ